jgi:antitoxin (DNA-binding transcriptional repressor) of toxin-antitoxin stability system
MKKGPKMKKHELKERIENLGNDDLKRKLLELLDRATPGLDDEVSVKGEVVVVLTNEETGDKRTYVTRNIVTNDGDLFYAERAVKTAIPTDFVDGSGDFDGIMELYNGASAAPAKGNDRSDLAGLVTGSDQAMDSGYPKINDLDADNTGAGTDIVTYLVSYAKGDANDTGIADVIITNPSPGASENVLMHAEFSSPFDKTSNDTLKVFVNHQMNGV